LIKVNYLFSFSSISIVDFFYLAEQPTEGPSVDPNAFNSDAPAKILDPKKTTIGQRRAPAAKKVHLYD